MTDIQQQIVVFVEQRHGIGKLIQTNFISPQHDSVPQPRDIQEASSAQMKFLIVIIFLRMIRR